MSKITGKENPIHTDYESTNEIKHNFYFLKTTDDHHQFLLTLYKSVIGQHAYPLVHQSRLIIHLDNLVALFDWAWSEFSDSQNYSTQGKTKPDTNPSLPSFSDYSVNDEDCTLHFSRWIPERRKLHQGNIRVLSQMDIYSINTFFQELFEHKSLRSWKETLIRWKQHALNPELGITDTGHFSAYEVYMDYEFLQKLGEIAWINLKQEEKLHFLDLYPWFHAENYPIFMAWDRPENPYIFLNEFFREYNLSVRIGHIDRWIKFALDINSVWDGNPSDLVWYYHQIGELIECCWLIRELGSNYPAYWNDRNSNRKDSKEEPDYVYHLPKEFIEKPENYLTLFYEKITLNDYHHKIFECLHGALGHEGLIFYGEDEIQKFHQDLVLLTEAAYLIQKMKFKKH